MFNWFRRRPSPNADDETVAAQPPGVVFPWPQGAVLTAIDELVLALPTKLLGDNRPIGECVFSSEDAEICIPPQGDTFFVRLAPGMSISLAKSVKSYIVADDGRPRRAKVKRSPSGAGAFGAKAEKHEND